MAIVVPFNEADDPEKRAHDAYVEHVADCLVCDTAGGVVCHAGLVLHRRWRAAQDAQREDAG